jgi:O-antigen/teichoic acid export membrane protein
VSARYLLLRAARGRLPTGTLPVGAGLVVLGVTSYGFLGIAARSLDAVSFAELSVVWTVLFTLGPGVFLPLEQETAKRLAVIRQPRSARQLVRRALWVSAALLVVVTTLTIIALAFLGDRLIGPDVDLWLAMIAANSVLTLVHCSRGWLAGTDRFGHYGTQLALDGTLRMAGAAVLLAVGCRSVSWYGWVLFGAQLVAVLATVWHARRQGDSAPLTTGGNRHADADEPDPEVASMPVLARSIGLLVTATLASQLVVNAGPVAVKALAAPTDVAAGHFLTTLIIARIPLFLFSALQASLLPGLARLVAAGSVAGVVHSLRRISMLLALLGIGLSALLAVAGPTLTGLIFGPSYRAERAPLVVLALGCTIYMLSSVLAQALLAVHATASVALGWWLGVLVFAGCLTIGLSLPLRVSLALLVGAAAAGGYFGWSLRRRLHAHPSDLRRLTPVAVDG